MSRHPSTPAAAPSPELEVARQPAEEPAKQLALALYSLVGLSFAAFGYYVAHRAVFGVWPDA